MERNNLAVNSLPLILQAKDIAYLLEISEDYARELMKTPRFPLVVIGKKLTVSREDFMKWLENKEIHTLNEDGK